VRAALSLTAATPTRRVPWLFGTNMRLDDRASIEVLGAAGDTAEFAMVVRAARQVASFQA
jgi:hypothetical protein